MASIELQKVSKVFRQNEDDPICAVDELSLSVNEGEFITVVGPSGCGKTTTLRMIAGLESPTAGTISVAGHSMENTRPHERDVAMVFQRDALLPHLSAFENIALGLQLRKVPPTEGERRMNETLELLGLKRLVSRLPRELSGGERQRVALARAIVRRPKIFLFDEPLVGLDAPLRAQMRVELARIHRRLAATMLYVTHDQEEALALGQRVAVMKNGALQQFAEPAVLCQSPATGFVAGFIGSPPLNLLRGHLERRANGYVFAEHNVGASAKGHRLEIPLDAAPGERLARFADGNVIAAVHPNRVTISNSGHGHAEVDLIELRGTETLLHLGTGAHRIMARLTGQPIPRRGDTVALSVDLSGALFFNPVSDKPITLDPR